MEHVCFDYARQERIGLPEAIFCEGKDSYILHELLQKFYIHAEPILFTRLEAHIVQSASKEIQDALDYHALSRTAFFSSLPKHSSNKKVGIVSAGSADASVAYETARTLQYLGIRYQIFEDCGVAGLWRLLEKIDILKTFDIIIVVAGLDAALISVLGGLLPQPIIAVPTSVGYGMAKKGEVALSSMLVSCAQGISVMNIDNGYGAACAAARILNRFSH